MRVLRGPIVVIVAAAALALSGCATADTAAVVNGNRISEQEAQLAAQQIQQAQPNSTITTPDAVAALIMAGFINEVADSVGKGLSDSAARAAIPTIENPAPTTLELVKSSLAWNQMTEAEHTKAIDAASRADITINPRYGTFDPKQVRFEQSSPNWIKAEPTATPAG
jgi:hypothetical protein